MKQLDVIQPKVVVLLGRVAAEGVLQKKVYASKEHGEVLEEKDGITYFLTVHPAAAVRFPHKYKQVFQEDFQKLKKLVEII